MLTDHHPADGLAGYRCGKRGRQRWYLITSQHLLQPGLDLADPEPQLAADAEPARKQERASTTSQSAPDDQYARQGGGRRGIDVAAVITKALTAAGLIK